MLNEHHSCILDLKLNSSILACLPLSVPQWIAIALQESGSRVLKALIYQLLYKLQSSTELHVTHCLKELNESDARFDSC